jgi:predicted metalloprotease with PDZ domain
VNRSSPILTCSAALLLCAAAASCQPTMALADPAASAPAPASQPDKEADLEAQLQAARRQLEAAAHQVAELSAQLSRPVIERFMSLDEDPGRAIIGVQLAPGARVREVSPGGPADEAGIRSGDVIVAVNGTEVKGEDASRQVVDLMRAVKPDGKVNVRVMRDGKPREFTLTARPGLGYYLARGFGPGPQVLARARAPLMLPGPLMDMELASLTPQLGRYFGTDQGVLVVRAPRDGALKLEDGDVILAIDGRKPTSGSHATRILASYQPGEKLNLRIMRSHKTLDLEATLPVREGGRAMILRDGPLAPLPPEPPHNVFYLRDAN